MSIPCDFQKVFKICRGTWRCWQTSTSIDLGFRSLANGLIILAAISGAVPALYSIMMIGCYGLYVIATLRDPKLEEAQEALKGRVKRLKAYAMWGPGT